MEPTTTPAPYADRNGDRGAGGKLRKPSSRKPPATPYARPPTNQRGSVGGWLSKIVDPAYRLVSGGATMLLPFFSSTSTSSSSLLPYVSEDKADEEVLPNTNANEQCQTGHTVHNIAGLAHSSEIAPAPDLLKTDCSSEAHGERQNISNDGSQISRIEQLIEGKSFSRNEVNRLMEILKSRVDREESNEATAVFGRTDGVLSTPSFSKANEGKLGDLKNVSLRTPTPPLQSAVQNAVGASPVDIARAYMGNRSLEPGPSPLSNLSKVETAPKWTDQVALNPFISSYSYHSSTCWPGAVVQDTRNYATPSQKSRYGLHDFPRTPYSRTIFSTSRDKKQANSRHLKTSPSLLRQLQTPVFGQGRSHNQSLNNSYGSVGPIRRIRNKFASEARPRGSVSLSSSEHAPPVFQPQNVFESVTSASEIDMEDRAGSSCTVPVPMINSPSNQTVKRILEQLDKNKPTPKEMADELKIAASWRKSSSAAFDRTQDSSSFQQAGKLELPQNTDLANMMLVSKDSGNNDTSNSQTPSPEKSISTSTKPSGMATANSGTETADGPPGFSIGPGNNSSSEDTNYKQESSEARPAKAGTDLPPERPSNGKHVISTTLPNQAKLNFSNKPPHHPSGSRPILPHISVGKHDLSRAVFSNNGAGFTFPVSTASSVLSEPPTPSVMPFSSNNLTSHSEEESSAPSFSFGEKSAARLVFAFPSTSSSRVDVDASGIEFKFATDKKRLSFGSVGNDAICY